MSDKPELDQDFINRTIRGIDNLIDVLEHEKSCLLSKHKTTFAKMMAINYFRTLHDQHHAYESIIKQILITGVYAAQNDREPCTAANTWRDDPYGHPIFQYPQQDEEESQVNKALRESILKELTE